MEPSPAAAVDEHAAVSKAEEGSSFDFLDDLAQAQNENKGEKIQPADAAESTQPMKDVAGLLLDAIKSGDEDTARELVEKHPRILKDPAVEDFLPLHLAVEHGRPRLVALLLDSGANVDTPDATSSRTALHVASSMGNMDITRLLYDRGADLEAISALGEKPLWLAASCSKEHVARFLLESEADPESFNPETGTTALLEAVKTGSASLVKLLLENGADVDAGPGVHERLMEGMPGGLDWDTPGLELPDGPATPPPTRISRPGRASVPGFMEPVDQYRPLGPGPPPGALFRPYGRNRPPASAPPRLPAGFAAGRKPVSLPSGPQTVAGPMVEDMEDRRRRRSSTKKAAALSWLTGKRSQAVEAAESSSSEDSLDITLVSLPKKSAEEQIKAEAAAKLAMEKDFKLKEEGKKAEAQGLPGEGKANEIHLPEQAKADPERRTPEKSGVQVKVGEEKPVRFKDAVGRKFTFPFHLVKTWKGIPGMEAFIEQAFLHIQPLGLWVRQGRYDLETSEGELILPSLWDLTIQPGWLVIMRMWPESCHNPSPPSKPLPSPPLGDQLEPIRFVTAVFQRINIPFHLGRRWNIMETFIKQACHHIDLLGPHVHQGHYDLFTSEDEIILPSVWDIVIKPGMNIQMRMWPGLRWPRPPPGPPSTKDDAPRRVPPGTSKHSLGAEKQNPLREAVLHGDPELVKLLLRHGANPRNRGRDGRSAQEVAEELNQELAGVLRDGVPLEGPPTTQPGLKDADTSFAGTSRPRAPARGSPKWQACQAFEAIAVQFRLDSHEERYQKTVSVYELLYGKGPRSIFNSQNQTEVLPKFTWYHLPANNMEWVEHLVINIFLDQQAQSEENIFILAHRAEGPSFGARLKEKLRILRSKTQKASHSGQSSQHSFMRPLCKEIHNEDIKPPGAGVKLGALSVERSSSMVAFIPYLHYENFHCQNAVTSFLKRCRESRPSPRQVLPRASHPLEHLIRAYLTQTSSSLDDKFVLQPRRSLDEYFYTHLQGTGIRDAEQVIWRFTSTHQSEPKIFMVDQLWMWILDESTIVTCSPLNWDSWTAEAGPGWHHGGLTEEDPLNVHKKVIDHLKDTKKRAPVSSVYDMAQLIADKCASLFDGHDLNHDLQFFDFFEHSIARVNHQATGLLERFRLNLTSAGLHGGTQHDSSDIRQEMKLLIEVQDISEELDILEMVLRDQHKTMSDLRNILHGKGVPGGENHVLVSHQEWIGRMKEINEKTSKALYHLLELKQAQHAAEQSRLATQNSSVTNEQLGLMRHQAMETTSQLQAANDQLIATNEQLDLMRKQAEETDKQSKTLMVFTVVTIVFMPSSFLAAVFAINLDAFPLNDAGRMPLGYFLKFLFTISAAACLPLLAVAFNLHRIGQWWAKTRKGLANEWQSNRSRLLGVLTPLGLVILTVATLVPIWTSDLSSVIKVAVTACLAIFLLLGILLWSVNTLIKSTARNDDVSASSSNSGSVSLVDD